MRRWKLLIGQESGAAMGEMTLTAWRIGSQVPSGAQRFSTRRVPGKVYHLSLNDAPVAMCSIRMRLKPENGWAKGRISLPECLRCTVAVKKLESSGHRLRWNRDD